MFTSDDASGRIGVHVAVSHGGHAYSPSSALVQASGVAALPLGKQRLQRAARAARGPSPLAAGAAGSGSAAASQQPRQRAQKPL